MTLSLLFVCLWVILAFVLQSIPSKDNHWRRAYLLIALGIPLVGWVTSQHGPFIGLAVLAVGSSVLRWPLFYLARWVRQRLRT